MTAFDSIDQRFRLSQQNFNQFADLSGDHNPIHVDPEYSASTRFGATVSHGMLLFTILRGTLHRRFPDYRLAEQRLMFPSPAYAGEPLTLHLERNGDGSTMVFSALIVKDDGNVCLEGQCILEPSTGNAR